MGYEANRKTFKLIFPDEELEGLEVVIRSTSMGNILRMAEIDEMNPLKLTKEDIEKLRMIFGILSKAMISWNLTEDGEPVPTTVDGLLDQDPEFVMSIIKGWTRAMTQVEPDLKADSKDGGQSLEASIPMESLSESRAS